LDCVYALQSGFPFSIYDFRLKNIKIKIIFVTGHFVAFSTIVGFLFGMRDERNHFHRETQTLSCVTARFKSVMRIGSGNRSA